MEVNASLAADIQGLLASITNDLAALDASVANVGGDVSNVDTNITGLVGDLHMVNSSLYTELSQLINSASYNDTALRAWIDTTVASVEMSIEDANTTLHQQLASISGDHVTSPAKLDAINQTLAQLSKLDDILADLTALDQALEDAETELTAELQAEEPEEGMNINTILLALVLVLLILNLLMNMRGDKGEASPKDNTPEQSDGKMKSEPTYESEIGKESEMQDAGEETSKEE